MLATMSHLVLIAVAGEDRICSLRLEEERLQVLTETPGLSGCGTFAVDADHDLLYAAYKAADTGTNPGEAAGPGVATLRLQRDSGALTELARQDVEESMTYLTVAHDGSVLLGASYGGNVGLTWPVTDGRLGEPVARVSHRHLHCVVTGVDDAYAYFVSLGDDLVAQFALGPEGSLTPLGEPSVSAPAGSGPRHLVVERDAAYLMTEFSGELIRYTVGGKGALTEQQRVVTVDPSAGLAHSRLGADPTEEHLIWGADVHRAGDWVLTSERSASTLAATPLESDGALGAVAHLTPTQRQPRGFAVTADGRYVVAVGEKSTAAELLRVEADGALTSLGTTEIGAGANWVRIL